ncbi:MAG: hypothetical protein FWE60_02780 [Oscillospiraceae bacterium]|nr:hypothetical protein [Oscillospiraceae bacterium]
MTIACIFAIIWILKAENAEILENKMKLCNVCWTECRDDWVVCANCGKKFETDEDFIICDAPNPISDSNTNYPCLSISKTILRIIGAIVFVSIVISSIAFARGDFVQGILREMLCCCDGFSSDGRMVLGGFIGFIIGLIAGIINGFFFFVLAEIIQLFVAMGKNVENLAQNVKQIAKREKE